jgi:hypothetical protein
MYFWKPQLVHFINGYPLTMFDWVIQDGRRPPPGTMDPAAGNIASGVFDASWRRQDRWTQLRDQQSASTWTLRRAPAKNFVASPTALQAVAGRYELSPGREVTLRVDGAGLVADIPHGPTIPLAPESESVFVVPATGNSVEIVRDAAGKISGASVEDHGSFIWAKRVP